jgi:hypothetical protein
LTGPVVTDALGIPRYAATIWIDFLHGDLAQHTRSAYRREAVVRSVPLGVVTALWIAFVAGATWYQRVRRRAADALDLDRSAF